MIVKIIPVENKKPPAIIVSHNAVTVLSIPTVFTTFRHPVGEYLENANCRAHARRDFSDAIKAIGRDNQKAIKESVACKALIRISAVYKLESALRELTPEERLKERQASIKPLIEEYFA